MDSDWLKTQFRLHPDKSRAGLAQALKLGPSAVSKILAGTRQIKAPEYAVMRRFFGLPVDGEAAVRQASARGKSGEDYVLGWLQPGGLNERGDPPGQGDDAWVMPASILRAHTQAPPDKVRVFTVQENAMAPDLLPGQHVLVDMSDRKPSPPGLFVISDGLGQLVRQAEYVPHSSPPAVRLSARNESYAAYTLPLDQAGIIGRVIAKLQWL